MAGPTLGEIVAAWPFAASVAVAAAAGGLWGGRRRTAVNEALHELRRPLQALALMPATAREADGELGGAVRMASEALARLDRAVNGGREGASPEPVRVRSLLDEALARWRPRAELGGGSVSLRWRAGDPVLVGDRAELSCALDNLIANALEHGGPRVVVTASVAAGVLRLVIADPGRSGARSLARRPGRWRERRRHGHGLRIVRRVAAAHGGRFELRRAGAETEAALELPLPIGAARR